MLLLMNFICKLPVINLSPVAYICTLNFTFKFLDHFARVLMCMLSFPLFPFKNYLMVNEHRIIYSAHHNISTKTIFINPYYQEWIFGGLHNYICFSFF